MAKLHFKYASMNSGKSIDLMRTVYNYEEKGFKVLVMKPLVDTKDGDFISSRVGLSRKVDILIDENSDIRELLKDMLDDVCVIFIDEVQFLSSKQIDDLFLISKAIDIPVICYGLRVNFMMESFEGSRRLLEIADVLEELQTLCECGSVARYVGRLEKGIYQVSGDTVVIDGSEGIEYVPLCGRCYLEKVRNIDLNNIF